MIRAVSDSDSFTLKNFTSENLTSKNFDAKEGFSVPAKKSRLKDARAENLKTLSELKLSKVSLIIPKRGRSWYLVTLEASYR